MVIERECYHCEKSILDSEEYLCVLGLITKTDKKSVMNLMHQKCYDENYGSNNSQ